MNDDVVAPAAPFWYRKHRSGLLASVSPLSGYQRYLAGSPTRTGRSPYQEIVGLDAAMRHADDVSECPQPCDCPDWTAT